MSRRYCLSSGLQLRQATTGVSFGGDLGSQADGRGGDDWVGIVHSGCLFYFLVERGVMDA